MKRLLDVCAIALLLAPLAAPGQASKPGTPYDLGLGDNRLALIDDPIGISFGGTPVKPEAARQTAAIVARSKGWRVLEDSEQRLTVARTIREHELQLEIAVRDTGLELRYLSST